MSQKFISTLSTIPVIVTPILPAIILGWTVYSVLPDDMGLLKVTAAIAAAIALEVVGISASHTALYFYRDTGKSAQTLTASAMVLFYIIIGAGLIYTTETNREARIIGVGAFLLALVSYITMALITDMQRTERYNETIMERSREVEERQARDRQEVLLLRENRKWEHKNIVAEQSVPEPEQNVPEPEQERTISAPEIEVPPAERAKKVLAKNPDTSGAELARLIAVSPSYGRRLKTAIQSKNGQSIPTNEQGVNARDRGSAGF